MQKFFVQYLDRLEDCHKDIHKALEGLPSVALDWNPGNDMNSISVLVYHLTGAERYWIGDVVMQESSNRDRDSEFKVHNVGPDVLKKRLDDTLIYVSTALEKMTLTDLEASRTRPSDGQEFTVAWAMLHALEHATLHLGQIQLTRQLWRQGKSAI